MPFKKYKIQQWLKSKTDIELEKYKNVFPLYHGRNMDISLYSKYYSENDQDIDNSDKDYKNLFEATETCNKTSKLYGLDDENHLEEDEFLKHIYGYMEKYGVDEKALKMNKDYADDGWNIVGQKKVIKRKNDNIKHEHNDKLPNTDKINVLIPANTNRYHANYLFKSMIDCADDFDMIYTYKDPRTNESVCLNLVDKNFKDQFYEFCYDNTEKSRFYY